MSKLPDWTLPYVGAENYTGPYLSNGQYQASVAFGDAEPKSKLDALSRFHDTAFATWEDYGHRTAANSIYNEEARKLESLFPQLAGSVVLYGNQLASAFSNLFGSFANPFQLIFGAVENMYNLNDYMMNEKKYRKDVLNLYAMDPRPPSNGRVGSVATISPGDTPIENASRVKVKELTVPVTNDLFDMSLRFGRIRRKRKHRRRRSA